MDGERNLFDRFGGVRPMADAMMEPPSTVQSWKTNGRIPATKQPDVLKKADELGIDVHAIDIIFPLRNRLDMDIPVGTSGRLPTGKSFVEAGAPISDCDRRQGSQQARRA